MKRIKSIGEFVRYISNQEGIDLSSEDFPLLSSFFMDKQIIINIYKDSSIQATKGEFYKDWMEKDFILVMEEVIDIIRRKKKC